jgi:hypothetical protein
MIVGSKTKYKKYYEKLRKEVIIYNKKLVFIK